MFSLDDCIAAFNIFNSFFMDSILVICAFKFLFHHSIPSIYIKCFVVYRFHSLIKSLLFSYTIILYFKMYIYSGIEYDLAFDFIIISMIKGNVKNHFVSAYFFVGKLSVLSLY